MIITYNRQKHLSEKNRKSSHSKAQKLLFHWLISNDISQPFNAKKGEDNKSLDYYIALHDHIFRYISITVNTSGYTYHSQYLWVHKITVHSGVCCAMYTQHYFI